MKFAYLITRQGSHSSGKTIAIFPSHRVWLDMVRARLTPIQSKDHLLSQYLRGVIHVKDDMNVVLGRVHSTNVVPRGVVLVEFHA